jgi:hypothetical protein
MLSLMHRSRRWRAYRTIGAVALAVGLSGPLGAPVRAAPGNDQTWVGDVERHGRHYDYLGRSCPIEESDPCPTYEVRYEIVPTTAQAARALPKVDGHRARLIGYREPVRRPGHNGTLMVSEVQSKYAPSDPVTGEP